VGALRVGVVDVVVSIANDAGKSLESTVPPVVEPSEERGKTGTTATTTTALGGVLMMRSSQRR
jgi:hypothetical protein